MRTTHLCARILIMLAITLALIALMMKSDLRMADGSAPPQSEPLTSLQGQAALDYLKQHGLYDQLLAAREESRYELVRVPSASLPLALGRASEAYLANNRAQHLRAYFSGEQVLLSSDDAEHTDRTSVVGGSEADGVRGWQLGLKLESLGYGGRQLAVGPGTPIAQANRVEYQREVGRWQQAEGSQDRSSIRDPQSAIKEWYVNGHAGVEQGFTLNEPPGVNVASQPLRVALSLTGDLQASLAFDGQELSLSTGSGEPVLRYAQLSAYDAQGRKLAAHLELDGREVSLVVDDAGAVYPVTIDPTVLTQQAYLKASNTEANDQFGRSVAISGDTVVVGALDEDSNATGVNGDQSNNLALNSGAAYVFVRSGTTWSQQAYLKASNTDAGDNFGFSVAISGDTVVVGALHEASNATGVNGDGSNNSAANSGAAYVFVRSGTTWSQQAYLKASNTDPVDEFGDSVAISGDTVVIGAPFEASNATGVNGDQTNNSAPFSGAAYVFLRSGTTWSQQAYLKASNTGASDEFGFSVAISADTVVVGATGEASNATGVNGDGSNNSASGSGAAYVFVRSGTIWSQQAYLKASNTDANDQFGTSVAVSADTVVVGANGESSNTTGVNGNQSDNSASLAGAAYVFVRSGTMWSQQAYLKASNTDQGDQFGFSVAISTDTVVVGAFGESSNATGVNGNQNDNSASGSGAAYVFVRSGTIWGQQAYLKASNTDAGDDFGVSVAVSGDTLVVGAFLESSNATGVNGNQSDNSASFAGAAYVFAPPPCTITCPPNQFAGTGPGATQCCAVVNYPAPTADPGCGTVSCSPASGSCLPVGTTTVTCNTTAGPSCQFTVTVTDTTPPTVTCPADINATGSASCPIATSVPVNFTATATDNCAVQSFVCNPPPGSTFPVGATTVTCIATDTSGNMASCTFTVNVFSFCLQDETNPGSVVLVNAQTGDFSFCCGGVIIASGRGTLTTRGCIGSIDSSKGDRQVHIQWDTSARNNAGEGTAYVQKRSNKVVCQITDKNMSNNTCQC